MCTLDDVLLSASLLLKAEDALPWFTDRIMIDIIEGMRKVCLEPKRIRMVHSSHVNKPPILVLVEGVLHGRPFKRMPPLIMYDENQEYTPELKVIYHME